MRKYIVILFMSSFLSAQLQAQQIVSITKVASFTTAEISQQVPLVVPLYPVDFYHVLYNTLDPHGNVTTASGALYVPIGCDSLPLASYQHGTTIERESVPSRGDAIALVFASLGYVTSAADFLGLGDNYLPHPYIHGESEATTSIDLMRAARTYVADSLSMSMNGQVFLVGYSQGGHATMATHKYIEDNNLLGEFDVVASAPLSGPYNMSGVQMQLPADSIYSNPTYFPYLVTGYQYVYGNLYTSLDQYYKSPYDVLIPQYLDGTYTIAQANAVLPANIYDMVQDSVLNNFLAQPNHPLQLAIKDNDNYDWLPTRPIQMAYCDGDEQVYYQNTITALTAMTNNGATDVTAVHSVPGATHAGCALVAFLQALNYIQSYSTACVNTTGITLIEQSDKVTIYPNPTGDITRINLGLLETQQDLQLEVISPTGQLLLQRSIIPTYEYDISLKQFGQGVFFIRLYNEDVHVIKRVIVHN